MTLRAAEHITDVREHALGTDTAVFSPDRLYRYAVTRTWGSGPTVCWIGLNPSVADAFTDDPTLRRIRSFTQRVIPGSGGFTVVNLYAYRATDPRELWTCEDPVGPCGDFHLESEATSRHALVIAAWGTHGARNGRGEQVARELAAAGVALHCLGTTRDGHPKHPLYVPGDTPIVPWRRT